MKQSRMKSPNGLFIGPMNKFHIGRPYSQTTVKLYFEPCVEPLFLEDSYGYPPDKSAIGALSVTRKRCWYP